MKVTYIHHSCFLVETERFYFLFDYEQGCLPELDQSKKIFVLSSHSHFDHYNPVIYQILKDMGMHFYAVVSDDIKAPEGIEALSVCCGKTYLLDDMLSVTTFQSTDLGVAFLIDDQQQLIYHAGDLHDWVWDEESDEDNRQMTMAYQKQIDLLCHHVDNRQIDVAFVVLDPRQDQDYDKGLCTFLKCVPVKQVYPMHCWGQLSIIDDFLNDHPDYNFKIQRLQENTEFMCRKEVPDEI